MNEHTNISDTNCPDESTIRAMLGGNVDADELSDLAQHISDCESCQNIYEQCAHSFGASRSADASEKSVCDELGQVIESLKTEGKIVAGEETVLLDKTSSPDKSTARPSTT